jgi:hypothetical protein
MSCEPLLGPSGIRGLNYFRSDADNQRHLSESRHAKKKAVGNSRLAPRLVGARRDRLAKTDIAENIGSMHNNPVNTKAGCPPIISRP